MLPFAKPQLPQELRQDGGYDHREALFGLPPYGGSIQQNVYYADSVMCDSNEDYSRGGYPTRENDSTGQMKPWVAPFILMVDRGDCTFVKKVRNAQKLGAAGVIIADNTCLCDAGDACKSDAEECETKEPIMADDGSGADITIPSFLMFKQDADPIKEKLKQNTIVRMSMSWALPRPDDRVEYDLWTTPKDEVSRPLQQNFREVANALGKHAQFTPHMYIYDGIFAGCQGAEGEDQCYNLCTNSGRYCATDPDDDLDSGISGADVVTESLRRLCIWKEYGEDDGVGMPWWDYVDEFLYRCDSSDYFTNDDCIEDCMKRSGIDSGKIKQCMADSGGLTENSENSILEAELSARETAGVVILPSFFVNNAPLRGALTVAEVFDAICAGYATGSEPTACKKCNTCDNVPKCVVQGHCPGAVDSLDTVSMPVFMGTLLAVVICFGLLGIVQWQRSQRQMRAQVRGIMAEYMPIDANNKVESVGIPTDDDDDFGVEIS
jgi:PA domain